MRAVLDPMQVAVPARQTTPREASPQTDRLRAVAQEFESLLTGELMKAMRRTVPRSALGGGFTQDVFTSMLDEQLARAAAGGTGFGLADSLVRELGGDSGVDPGLAERLRDGSWVRPLEEIPAVDAPQRFGASRDGLRPAECGAGHCGVDLAEAEGVTVYAAQSGVVTGVGRDPDSVGGLWVEVSHDAGIVTRYLHLHTIRAELERGTAVRAGHALGEVGRSGTNAHGPHLHFELRHHGKYLDPGIFFPAWGSPGRVQALAKTVDDKGVAARPPEALRGGPLSSGGTR